MSPLNEDILGSLSQCFSLLIRKALVTSFHKIMIEGSVGAFWRTDGHIGEVQVINGVSGDRGGDGILLPFFVGLCNQNSSSDESKADN